MAKIAQQNKLPGSIADHFISGISKFEDRTQTHRVQTTADAIITVLAYKHPLTAKQVYSETRKLPIKPVSYRATHKMLQQLEQRGIIGRDGKVYALDTGWVRRIRKLADDLESAGPLDLLAFCDMNNGSAMVSVNSLNELHKLILRTYLRYAAKPIFAECDHLDWPLLYPDELFRKELIQGRNEKLLTISRQKTELDKWCMQLENAIGMKTVIGAECAKHAYLLAVMDYVISYSLPKAELSDIHRIYSSIQNLTPKNRKAVTGALQRIYARPIQMTVQVTNNPTLAASIRENVLRHFQK